MRAFPGIGGAGSARTGRHGRRIALGSRHISGQPEHQPLKHNFLFVVIAVAHLRAPGVPSDLAATNKKRSREAARVVRFSAVCDTESFAYHNPPCDFASSSPACADRPNNCYWRPITHFQSCLPPLPHVESEVTATIDFPGVGGTISFGLRRLLPPPTPSEEAFASKRASRVEVRRPGIRLGLMGPCEFAPSPLSEPRGLNRRVEYLVEE